jgi:hypothetical protein
MSQGRKIAILLVGETIIFIFHHFLSAVEIVALKLSQAADCNSAVRPMVQSAPEIDHDRSSFNATIHDLFSF